MVQQHTTAAREPPCAVVVVLLVVVVVGVLGVRVDVMVGVLLLVRRLTVMVSLVRQLGVVCVGPMVVVLVRQLVVTVLLIRQLGVVWLVCVLLKPF